MSVPFTIDHTNWQQGEKLEELHRAFSERYYAAFRGEYGTWDNHFMQFQPFEADEESELPAGGWRWDFARNEAGELIDGYQPMPDSIPLQSASFWRGMQEIIDSEFFVLWRREDGSELNLGAFDFWSWTNNPINMGEGEPEEVYSAGEYGYRRVTELDGQGDPVFTFGYHESGDIIGYWLVEDLITAFTFCRYAPISPVSSSVHHWDSTGIRSVEYALGCATYPYIEHHADDIIEEHRKAYKNLIHYIGSESGSDFGIATRAYSAMLHTWIQLRPEGWSPSGGPPYVWVYHASKDVEYKRISRHWSSVTTVPEAQCPHLNVNAQFGYFHDEMSPILPNWPDSVTVDEIVLDGVRHIVPAFEKHPWVPHPMQMQTESRMGGHPAVYFDPDLETYCWEGLGRELWDSLSEDEQEYFEDCWVHQTDWCNLYYDERLRRWYATLFDVAVTETGELNTERYYADYNFSNANEDVPSPPE